MKTTIYILAVILGFCWLINNYKWNVEMDWVNVIGWRPIEYTNV